MRSIDQNGRRGVSRHYTICNAMIPDVYRSYIKALKPDTDPEYEAFDARNLPRDESSTMSFCIKNYRNPKGLSTKIHDNEHD